MKKQLKADIGLILVTFFWGSSFLLTKYALLDLDTFNFLGVRFLIAGFASFLIFFKKMIRVDKRTLKMGILLGIMLYIHYLLQTLGIAITTVSKSAFITGTNVVMVPIFSAFFMKKLPAKSAVLGVFFAFVGMTFLTLNAGSFSANIGDLLTLICAIVFAIYIILIGKYTSTLDSISFAIVQIFVVGILSTITSFIFEKPHLPTNIETWGNVVFLALICTSGAYIIQSIAQQYTSPTHTALIYSGEPVFAAMFAYLIAGEILTPKGVLGATLIVLGVLVAEIDFKNIFNKKKEEIENENYA